MLGVITDRTVLIIVFNLKFCTEFTLTTFYALRPMFYAPRSTLYALR